MIRRRRGKFGNRRTRVNGRVYPSQLEADVRAHLDLLVAAGELSALEDQPLLRLLPHVTFRPDFTAVERGRRIWIEAKGYDGERWRVIRNVWKDVGPGVLRVYKRGARGGLRVAEELCPNLSVS